MQTAALTPSSSSNLLEGSRTAQQLSGEDFFKLLIAQLSNQDPLDPTSNQELLNQIASIRDIELSTTLSESLKQLSDQQRYGSAAALIGRYVTGRPDLADPNASRAEGVVVGVRFSDQGRPFLQLDTGLELPLEDVATVVTSERAAAALLGRTVTGVDTSDSDASQVIEGVVTGVRSEADGRVVLELDTGETLELGSVVSTTGEDLFFGDTTPSI